MSHEDRLAFAFLGLHPDRASSLADRFGSIPAAVAAIRDGRVDGIDATRLWTESRRREALQRARCRAVLRGDPAYPAALDDIGDPPDVVFVRGDVPVAPTVGVVGTRRCTAYGRRLAHAYGRAIADAGWVLVSGLARGIDGSAHRATVEAGGVGVAVLGCGIDVDYPREHAGLAAALVDGGGAIMSEYPPGAEPLAWRFPPRNRLISGLARAVVVVESAATGGALVTAARAAEQGRTVFATPGDVGRSVSQGCNLLIRDGAVPVLDAPDLVEALSLVLGPPRRPDGAAPPDGDAPSDLGIAADGVTLDAFGDAIGLEGAPLLALVGRLEMEGKVVRRGDRILPA